MTTGASRWALSAEDAVAIEGTLEGFRRAAGARTAALVDRAGQLVTAVGDPLAADPAAFGSLAAADVAATDELARLVGESAFGSLVHQGERSSLLLADVARRVILVALFDDRTTLGLVRLAAKASVPALAARFDAVFARGSAGRPGDGPLAGAADEIDRLLA